MPTIAVMPLIIAVGSENPAKLRSVTLAFQQMFPDERIEVIGRSVPSNVSAQPMSDDESIQGN